MFTCTSLSALVASPGCRHHLFDTRHQRAQPAGLQSSWEQVSVRSNIDQIWPEHTNQMLKRKKKDQPVCWQHSMKKRHTILNYARDSLEVTWLILVQKCAHQSGRKISSCSHDCFSPPCLLLLRDLVAIIAVLEFNQWFTKLSTKDYKLVSDFFFFSSSSRPPHVCTLTMFAQK